MPDDNRPLRFQTEWRLLRQCEAIVHNHGFSKNRELPDLWFRLL